MLYTVSSRISKKFKKNFKKFKLKPKKSEPNTEKAYKKHQVNVWDDSMQ